jgi:hypothetical protein
MMKKSTILYAFSTLWCSVAALGQNATVTTSSTSGLLQLAGNGHDGQILLSADDWWGVVRAAEDLAGDFGKVVGKNLTLANYQGGQTTVHYSYQPGTSFVNVSSLRRQSG